MTKICVIYSKKSRPSAKALAASIRDSSGITVFRGLPSLKRLRRTEMDVIINVGNSKGFIPIGNPPIVNHPSKIRISANKRMARTRFKARKIQAPTLWFSYKDIPKHEYPVVGRTTYHMKGKGFWFCRNRAEAKAAYMYGATHFIKFIKNTREFRAHVFATTIAPKSKRDFVVAKLSEKLMSEHTDTDVIKNHEHGYKFLAPKKMTAQMRQDLLSLAIEAIYRFGLHYGGVDIVYSKHTLKPYVLEINTTPCLTDTASNTLHVYTQQLLRMIGYEQGIDPTP